MPHFTPENEELCPERTVITFQAKSGTSPTVQAEEGLDGRWKMEEKAKVVRPGSSALGLLASGGQEAFWVVYGKKIDGS
jgi:hypothetical protein